MPDHPIDVMVLADVAGIPVTPDEVEPIRGVVAFVIETFAELDLGDLPEDTSLDPRWR